MFAPVPPYRLEGRVVMRMRTLTGVALLVVSTTPAWAEMETSSGALLDAAARGDRARLSALLAGGADPDARDGEGRPALTLAAASAIIPHCSKCSSVTMTFGFVES